MRFFASTAADRILELDFFSNATPTATLPISHCALFQTVKSVVSAYTFLILAIFSSVVTFPAATLIGNCLSSTIDLTSPSILKAYSLSPILCVPSGWLLLKAWILLATWERGIPRDSNFAWSTNISISYLSPSVTVIWSIAPFPSRAFSSIQALSLR